MNNEETLNFRKTIPQLNNFGIVELRKMPKYFGWVSYSVSEKNKINLFLGGDDDGVALRCFWNKHYEKKTLEIWSHLCTAGGIILDIGAHSGIYSLVANNSIKKSKGAVFSFEPHYLNFARLNLNFRANSFSTKTLFMNAVGENNEVLPFSVFNNPDYLTSGGAIGKLENRSSTLVETIAIDNFLNEFGKRNLKVIKIDVEGHEYRCFLGMEKAISASRPVILFECVSQTNNAEIYSFLETYGYRIFVVDDIKNQLEETSEITPIFDDNNDIIHNKINRIAVPKTNIDLLSPFF